MYTWPYLFVKRVHSPGYTGTVTITCICTLICTINNVLYSKYNVHMYTWPYLSAKRVRSPGYTGTVTYSCRKYF